MIIFLMDILCVVTLNSFQFRLDKILITYFLYTKNNLHIFFLPNQRICRCEYYIIFYAHALLLIACKLISIEFYNR